MTARNLEWFASLSPEAQARYKTRFPMSKITTHGVPPLPRKKEMKELRADTNLKTNIQEILHDYPLLRAGTVRVVNPDKVTISWKSGVSVNLLSEHGLSVNIVSNAWDQLQNNLRKILQDQTIEGASARFRALTAWTAELERASAFDSQLCEALAELKKNSR